MEDRPDRTDPADLPDADDSGVLTRYLRLLPAVGLAAIAVIAVFGFMIRDTDRDDLTERVAAAAESEGEGVEAECVPGERCEVTYNVGERPAGDEEVLDRQREVWLEISSDPELEMASVTLTAEDADGSPAPVVTIECDRFADRAIEWPNATPELVRTVCNWDVRD